MKSMFYAYLFLSTLLLIVTDFSVLKAEASTINAIQPSLHENHHRAGTKNPEKPESDQNDDYFNEINLSHPFVASMTALLLKPDSSFIQKSGHINLFPQRLQCEAIQQSQLPNKNIEFKYKLQDDLKAPLMIVIPGTGGDANKPMAQYFGMLAYRVGYSVIEILSSTNYAFGLAASGTGQAGYLPQDAKDYYQLLKAIKNQIIALESTSSKTKSLSPSKIGLIGYSYGGLDISFLLAEDLKQKVFNFDFAVLLNPPFSRSFAVNRVDHYSNTFDVVGNLGRDIYDLTNGIKNPIQWIFNLGESATQNTTNYLEALVLGLINQKIVLPNLPGRLEDFIPLTSSQAGIILANGFRRTTNESAYTNNLIRYCEAIAANPNAPIEVPQLKNSLSGSIGDYLKNGPLRDAAIKEFYEQEQASRSTVTFSSDPSLTSLSPAITSSISSEEQNKLVSLWASKAEQSELDYAFTQLQQGYAEKVKRGERSYPRISIFHATNDFLTFGYGSPAETLMTKWGKMNPRFVEFTSLSEEGGHMGQFINPEITKQLIKTLHGYKQ